MQSIPTDEQILAEIRDTIKANPKFKQCINCVHYDRYTAICSQSKRTMYPYLPGCNLYKTAEEMLIKKAKEELIAQARECEKIEFLLAMALTSANMTTLFIEDFERRVKAIYKREKEKGSRSNLRKDLDLAEQMKGAFHQIQKFLETMRDMYFDSVVNYADGIEKNLEKIEQQYRHYIQTHVDKIFKKDGNYNVTFHDQFHADAGEFATFLLEMARVSHHNKDNADELYQRMRQMRNYNPTEEDNTFCLDDDDIKHYRLKD